MVSDQLSEKILTDKLQQREKTSLAELIWKPLDFSFLKQNASNQYQV